MAHTPQGQMAARTLVDARMGKNTQHSMLTLLRQGLYGRIAGYEDTNDAGYPLIETTSRRTSQWQPICGACSLLGSAFSES